MRPIPGRTLPTLHGGVPELCREIAAGAALGRAAGDFTLAIDGLRWSAIGVRDRGMPGG